MSGKRPINWRESDTEKLTREIERFNAKIYRARHNHPENADILPETIKRTEKTEMINKFKEVPRAEFNKEIKSLKRFSDKRGAENIIVSKTGNKVTNWEKNEVALQVAQINRERTKERKIVENMEATTRGKKIGLKRGEMGSERLNALKPKKFDFDKIKPGKEWEKFKETVTHQASPVARDKRMETYKQNYIQGLRAAFGDYASDIIATIESLPADLVVKTYYGEQEATIDFFYEPQEMDTKLDILDDIWTGVKEEHDETLYE